MFRVFEKFLEKRPDYIKDDRNTKNYLDEYIRDLPFDPNIVRWHVAVLFDEYLFKPNIIMGIFGNWRFDNPAEHFNRSGQELYDSLREKYSDKVQQK